MYPDLYPADYYPGVLPDGSQVLLRSGGAGLSYGLWFTPDGWLREFRYRYRELGGKGPAETQGKRSAEAVFAWQEEIGCRPGLIRVRQFVISRPVSVLIAEYAASMMDIVDVADAFSYDEVVPDAPLWHDKQYLDRWRARGNFILSWDGSEFILDGEGQSDC
jgi:hypothetical protein